MTPSNMAAIAASLQTSLQNCSLDHHHTNTTTNTNTAGGSGFATSSSSSSSSSISNHHSTSSSDATLELNSNTSLPYHWEQFLDLQTGEVYYINWRTGMKAKEDPRMTDHCSDEEEEEDEEESSYDEEGSSSESSSAASSSKKDQDGGMRGGSTVLVVGGCKSCFMYFMVAKQLEECPKCNGQLLHFNQSLHNP